MLESAACGCWTGESVGSCPVPGPQFCCLTVAWEHLLPLALLAMPVLYQARPRGSVVITARVSGAAFTSA